MWKLTQKLKDGVLRVLEVPMPNIEAGTLLVRNHFSLISAGTEGSTVKTARSSLIEKAKERPQQVKQVIDTLRTQGITQTYRAVMKKLDAYSSIGYSCAGEVIEIASDVTGIKVGDRVACAGLAACHAEIVSVPAQLCVRLEMDADLRQAAYNTLGSIAFQGVRQADLRIGESCAVIGLGLLGQITALILRAGGIRVAGIDIDPEMVEIAGRRCVDLSLQREDPGIVDKIMRFTGGLGCDAIIITAATDSLDPINFAGSIARKRGTVVVVGNVPTGFDREPHYYKKELQLKMSCSYGPGRYDPLYEGKGIDYPPAYVRWTENRNMAAFQELLYTKKIDVGFLTTHVFPLEKAPEAYDLLLKKTEPYIGILIEYDVSKELATASVAGKVPLREISANRKPLPVGIGFIGAGSYAQSSLLPNIPTGADIERVGVMTATGAGSRSVGERFGFGFCTTSAKEILDNDRINTVFIASRHDSHGAYVLQSIAAGKHVFVEKPLCCTEKELSDIAEAYRNARTPDDSRPLLMVGFNRRFSPLSLLLREKMAAGPMAMAYRVNAGAVPMDSWVQDPACGGRIVGEVCHFIDYLTWLNGSVPVAVHAASLAPSSGVPDTVTLNLTFANGSIGTVAYFANGDKSLPKERIEVFGSGVSAVVDDFRSLVVHGKGRKTEKRLLSQDKGQKELVRRFIESVRAGGNEPIPFHEIYRVTLATFKALESLRSGERISFSG